MPWKAVSVMDARIEFVLRAQRKEAPISRLCQEYGVSRQCGHLWLERYRQSGSFTALQDRSRRPQRSPRRTPEPLEERVVALRAQQGWGARKIGVLLAEQGWALPEWTINRILKRRGLLGEPARRVQAVRRFERPEPNQLAQLDFKGEYRLLEGWCYPLSLLDDHSRYLLGLWALPSLKAPGVQAALEGLFREQGVPQALLLDRGTPWWSTTNGHGLTWLSVWLMDQEIQLVHGRAYHPQTRGKVERFHRTLKERTLHEGLPESLAAWQAWARRFRTEYNEHRPHEALGMRRPAQVYSRKNLRPYQEQPQAYDYGGAQTRQLNALGCVSYGGRRYFVCEALADRWVRIDELDGLLLVTYRATTIREIDLRTGRTQAVVLPARSQKL
jgi:transposase InsO family protein